MNGSVLLIEYEKVITSMEEFIKECEQTIEMLPLEVRNRVEIILQENTPLLSDRIIQIEKSTTPEKDMVIYMSEVIRLFYKSIAASIAIIDPKMERMTLFRKMYLNINASFDDIMKHSKVLGGKTPEERNNLIKEGVKRASK